MEIYGYRLTVYYIFNCDCPLEIGSVHHWELPESSRLLDLLGLQALAAKNRFHKKPKTNNVDQTLPTLEFSSKHAIKDQYPVLISGLGLNWIAFITVSALHSRVQGKKGVILKQPSNIVIENIDHFYDALPNMFQTFSILKIWTTSDPCLLIPVFIFLKQGVCCTVGTEIQRIRWDMNEFPPWTWPLTALMELSEVQSLPRRRSEQMPNFPSLVHSLYSKHSPGSIDLHHFFLVTGKEQRLKRCLYVILHVMQYTATIYVYIYIYQ